MDLTRLVAGLARQNAHGQLVSVLEGGYNLETGQTVAGHIGALTEASTFSIFVTVQSIQRSLTTKITKNAKNTKKKRRELMRILAFLRDLRVLRALRGGKSEGD